MGESGTEYFVPLRKTIRGLVVPVLPCLLQQCKTVRETQRLVLARGLSGDHRDLRSFGRGCQTQIAGTAIGSASGYPGCVRGGARGTCTPHQARHPSILAAFAASASVGPVRPRVDVEPPLPFPSRLPSVLLRGHGCDAPGCRPICARFRPCTGQGSKDSSLYRAQGDRQPGLSRITSLGLRFHCHPVLVDRPCKNRGHALGARTDC